MLRRLLILLFALALIQAPAALAEPALRPPTERLLDVWLDIQLLTIFYPDAEPAALAANLTRIAAQLGQPAPMIRHGLEPRDTLRHSVRAVVICPTAPADTLVMWARSRQGAIYELIDKAGALRIFRVP